MRGRAVFGPPAVFAFPRHGLVTDAPRAPNGLITDGGKTHLLLYGLFGMFACIAVALLTSIPRRRWK